MVKKFDFLVIGSGLAGMSFALKVAHKGKVALICKAGLEEAKEQKEKQKKDAQQKSPAKGKKKNRSGESR